MILYLVYKKRETAIVKDMKLPQHTTDNIVIIDIAAVVAPTTNNSGAEKESNSVPLSDNVIITNEIELSHKLDDHEHENLGEAQPSV